ncbi:uncharacterized protein LOC118749197 [Rhagoletis pomonella]|uniref:uncharacterized protein LOC118749197 n=1 Tax=Rhagoletis pomonella TaxID=28610 RepID=UPI00177D1FA9|nr:uncharacterized protein LOC118749197 [Rhagoletis pomonella]
MAILMEIQGMYSFNDLILLENFRQRASRQEVIYLHPRVISEDINEIMSGDRIKTRMYLRISASTFTKIVQTIPRKHHGWSCEYEVICFLFWMACGCSYRVAAAFMGFSRYTVRNIIHKMLEDFLKLRHLINHGSVNDYDTLGLKFCRKAKNKAFIKFIGAIDGTHIRTNALLTNMMNI